MFKLAGHLKMTVLELSSKISSEELSEWYAYNSISPIGDSERIELMIASHMAMTANINRRKNSKSFRPKDFLPEYDKQDLKQSTEQMKALLMAMAGKK